MEKVWICVYRTTIEEHEDVLNLTEVQVTREFAEQYFKERIMTCKYNEWETLEEFLEECTADDTVDFYDYAMEHNAVIQTENW